MKSWQREAYLDVGLKGEYWVVDKQSHPDILNDWQVVDSLVSADQFSSLPAGLDKDEVFLVDAYKCPHKFRTNTPKIELKIGTRKANKFPIEMGAMFSGSGGTRAAVAGGEGPQNKRKHWPQEQAVTPKPPLARKLREVPSDPDKEPWPVRLGRMVVKSVAAQKWHSHNSAVSDTVGSCLQEYQEYVTRAELAEPGIQFPEHVPRFVEYVTMAVLDHAPLQILKLVAAMFAELGKNRPDVLHPCTHGILELADAKDGAEAPDLRSMESEWRVRFRGSNLWRSWVSSQAATNLRSIQKKHASGQEVPDMSIELQKILDAGLLEKEKAEAEFAKTVFASDFTNVQKLDFLLADSSRLSMPKQWKPMHPWITVLSMAADVLEDMAPDKYLISMKMLAKYPLVVEKVSNPGVKQMLNLLLSLQNATSDHGDDRWQPLAEQLLLEVSFAKVQWLKRTSTLFHHGCLLEEEIPTALAKSFHKTIVGVSRKYHTESVVGSALHYLSERLHRATSEQQQFLQSEKSEKTDASPVSRKFNGQSCHRCCEGWRRCDHPLRV